MNLRLLLLVGLLGSTVLAACGSAADDTIDAVQDELPAVDDDDDGADDGQDQLPLGSGPFPVGTIEITITHPDREDVAYIISCLGDTATVTPAVDGLSDFTACEQLGEAEVQTRLVDGAPADQVCTEIYGGPDEAQLVGNLDGQVINTVVTRNNGCGISDWDDTLSAVLPAAVGPTS